MEGQRMKNLNVTKLAVIKNYEAGKKGNLLAIYTDKIVPISVINAKDQEKDIEVLICTATIADEKTKETLEKYLDATTPANKIIVVSSKFMKLSNKKQLALLELENSKVRFEANEPDSNVASLIQAEVTVIEKFGKMVTFGALNKARKFREKSEKKATKGLHRAYKKDMKLEKKLAKAGEKCKKDYIDPEDMEDFREVHDEPVAAQ
jgi:hypothetical protein